MSRRRAARLDSLELLLDTICNTFGGVLFIAILVVLLLRQTSVSQDPGDATEKPISPLELESLLNRFEAISQELSRLRQNRDSQDELVRAFAPDEVRQLLANRNETVAKQTRLQDMVDRLLVQNAETAGRIETMKQDHRDARHVVDQARKQQQQLELQLESLRQSRVKQTQLPLNQEEPFKTEIAMILRYGRLYVWHKYGPGHHRIGLNTDDFAVVGEQEGGLVTHPIPSRGIPLNDSADSQEAVLRKLREFDPNSTILGVLARPDSFGQFQFLRDPAIQLGFKYRLYPTAEDDPIADRGGHGGHVQ